MQVCNNQINFGAGRHISGVRQAARNLRGVYDHCQSIECLPSKKGGALLLDRLMSKKTSTGFDAYIRALSVEEVRALLNRASEKLKATLTKKTQELRATNPKDLSPCKKFARKKVEDYLKKPLVLLPER